MPPRPAISARRGGQTFGTTVTEYAVRTNAVPPFLSQASLFSAPRSGPLCTEFPRPRAASLDDSSQIFASDPQSFNESPEFSVSSQQSGATLLISLFLNWRGIKMIITAPAPTAENNGAFGYLSEMEVTCATSRRYGKWEKRLCGKSLRRNKELPVSCVDVWK